jgi:aspartyl/asparaginyl-tRNA synthetase
MRVAESCSLFAFHIYLLTCCKQLLTAVHYKNGSIKIKALKCATHTKAKQAFNSWLQTQKSEFKNMFRTNTCGELTIKNVGENVTLAGWVQTIRKFGAITFVDLRDRYGITQLLFGEELNKQLEETPLGREFVLQVKGVVTERSNKNKNIVTGEIEITLNSFKILNKSETPPFTIQDDTDGGDDLRMKYRYLDLRRNCGKEKFRVEIFGKQKCQKLFT